MSLLAYSFASGIMLLALAAVYMLMMRNTTHFGFNRMCLVLIMTVSLVTPFISLPSVANSASIVEAENLTLTGVAIDNAIADHDNSIINIIGIIYIFGVCLVGCRTAANFGFIVYLRHNSRRKVTGSLTVRVHSHDKIPPMSWGGEIYISEAVFSGNDVELAMILAHESAHSKQRHWADLLLSNVVTAINWYNPAAWMMQHELIAVHEYEADRIASAQSDDRTQYQLLLIKKTAGTRFQAFADSLNHSSLKKRITMMTKNQSKRSTRLCSLALVPAMALALVASNSSCVKAAQQEVTAADQVKHALETVDDNSKGNTFELEEAVVVAYGGEKEEEEEKTPEIATLPRYVGGEAAMYKKFAEVINFVGDINESGYIIVGFTIDAEGKMVNPHIVKGLSEAKNNEAIRAVKQLTDWEPALTKDGKKVACDYTLPISFKTAPVKKK